MTSTAANVEIEVRVFASLRAALDPDLRGRAALALSLPAPATVSALIARLGLDAGAVAIVVVGGRKVGRDATLAPGDVVGLFPAVVGG